VQRKTICKLNWHIDYTDNYKGGIMAQCFFATDAQIKIYLKDVELSEVHKLTFSK